MPGFIEIIITLFTLVPLAVLAYYKWSHTHWERRNVPCIEPSIPWGSSHNFFSSSKSFVVTVKDFYDEFKSKGYRYGGIYLITRPALLIVDPELIKKILTKDFQYFTGRGVPQNEKRDPLSGNLSVLGGEKWRNMRAKLTPTFSSGKMKMMFPIMLSCGEPMVDYISDMIDLSKPVDIKDVLASFTTDIIGSCAFGVECNSFKYPDAEFRVYGRKMFEMSWRVNLIRFLSFIIPRLNTSRFEKKALQYFLTTFKTIIKYRERNNVQRNDFVQLLLEIKRKAENTGSDDVLTIDQMAVQAVLFFAAGFETSSTTLSFCLHELAHNVVIQQKLREEITTTLKRNDDKLTYDCIIEMKYLNMVLEETLRKYPPVSALTRVCDKDYAIEDTGTVIDAGTTVFFSILGMHKDPEYFPDPEKFDPERFSEQNRALIRQFSYIPFGEGPRICIALRFGQMQVKVGLCLLLKNYIFTPHETMHYNMDFHKNSQVLSFRDTLLLNAQRVS